jgi:hypothetical protein
VSGLNWEEINALVLKARETERERIIKLLEDKGTHPQCRNQPPLKLDGSIAWCKEGGEYCTMTLRQIGHIKGENK